MELGLGTHRYSESIEDVLTHAISSGCRLIDTAPNYGAGLAQALTGIVLRSADPLPQDLRITTKTGFLVREDLAFTGNFTIKDSHSLDPKYILYRAQKNARLLKPVVPSCLYIHNPEIQARRIGQTEMGRLLHKVFEACEDACERGLADSYGVATWKDFLASFPLWRLARIAHTVAGATHRFKSLQMPLSLVRLESIKEATNDRGPLKEGPELGIEIMASSPLHTGELPQIVDEGFALEIEPGFSSAQLALQFARSAPGVSSVLVSCSSTSQYDELRKVFKVAPWPLAKLEEVIRLVS